jgi:hypothetical protein
MAEKNNQDGEVDGFAHSFINLWTGRVDRVAYALFGAWLIGMGLNYLTGSQVSVRTALLGLAGNLFVVAIALAIKLHQKRK